MYYVFYIMYINIFSLNIGHRQYLTSYKLFVLRIKQYV